ncbi:hypothetical protein CFB39_23990 [Burkholderia sp. AU6039]|nr:hypothetical protein CFB39_23990 [Burkholderia sp. AU6039]
MNFFAGKNWWDITLESLEKEYVGDGSACLSFMSPMGRNYYLPAYLLIACEQYYEGDVISQGLPGRLKMYAGMDDFYQISSLGNAKMQVVAKVLKFMHEVYDEEDAKDALDLFWGKFLS